MGNKYKSAEQVMGEWMETSKKKSGSLSIIDVLGGKNVITEAIEKAIPKTDKKK